MKNVLLFALMLSGVAGSSAAEVATKYACPAKLSPEHMVKMFVGRVVLDEAPCAVEDSISYYAARSGFTAFGLPLVAVAAFEEGTTFFARAPGTSPANRFALIVHATHVQMVRVAQARRLSLSRPGALGFPQIGVATFHDEMAEPLPKSASPRYLYAQIVCYPHI